MTTSPRHIAMVASPAEDLLADAERAARSAQLRTDALAEGGTRRAADLIEDMLS